MSSRCHGGPTRSGIMGPESPTYPLLSHLQPQSRKLSHNLSLSLYPLLSLFCILQVSRVPVRALTVPDPLYFAIVPPRYPQHILLIHPLISPNYQLPSRYSLSSLLPSYSLFPQPLTIRIRPTRHLLSTHSLPVELSNDNTILKRINMKLPTYLKEAYTFTTLHQRTLKS